MFIIYFNIYLYHINFANYFDNSDGGKIVLFLLKHSFKTKTLHLFVWRRNKSCYVFKVLLNYRLYRTHVYEAATLNLLAERLFWVSFCFKKNVVRLQIYRKVLHHCSFPNVFMTLCRSDLRGHFFSVALCNKMQFIVTWYGLKVPVLIFTFYILEAVPAERS